MGRGFPYERDGDARRPVYGFSLIQMQGVQDRNVNIFIPVEVSLRGYIRHKKRYLTKR